ncbi:MAG TPA: hypothetical protein VFW40_06510 [Capsulimonadaceae bacterium]|nr:hypothetical protein [Capsulimonadaceae bacterium]
MEMKELIDPHQAQMLMIAVLIVAPVVGLIWGAAAKRILTGFLIGLAIGVGNFALWILYNTITNSLGLDTVKNLLVNLALFIVLGAIIGAVIGARNRRPGSSENGGSAPVPAAVGGGPQGKSSGASTRKGANEPPRDP